MKKVFKRISLAILLIISVVFFLYITSEWWCPSMWGSHSLGNNLYAMDWDNGVQIIVYNENPHGKTVYGGAYVVPNDSTHHVGVKITKSNQKWIIVKAVKNSNNTECYYLIDKSFNINGLDWQKDNCDSIIQSHITEFSNLSMFYEYLNNKEVELDFDK